MVMSLESSIKVQQKEECQKIFSKMDLDEQFKLPPWGIDTQKSYEPMKTIEEDGTMKIINKKDKELQVRITKELINESLKLPLPDRATKIPYQLTKLDQWDTFLSMLVKHETFISTQVVQ